MESTRTARTLWSAPFSLGASENESLVARVIDAPRELVFRMWTEAEHISRWLHPDGFDTVVCEEADVRPGGVVRLALQQSDGARYVAVFTFREIAAPERVVFDETCSDGDGPIHRARVTVRLEVDGARTLLTIHAEFDWIENRDPQWTHAYVKQLWNDGWSGNVSNLARCLGAHHH